MPLEVGSTYFESLVERLASDAELDELVLDQEGQFHNRRLTAADLAGEVTTSLVQALKCLEGHEFPRIVYGIGRARCGSTSLADVFSRAGVAAFYQPVKSLLRQALTGCHLEPWPIGPVGPVFAKETFGPYSLAECLYDPVDLLLRAGYPPDRMHVVAMDRAPDTSLASWIDKWSHRVEEAVLVAHFIVATLNLQRVVRRAACRGVPTTWYVYEASGIAEAAVERLFARVGEAARFSKACISDRGGAATGAPPPVGSVIFPAEPAVFEVKGLHDLGTPYRFRQRALPPALERHLRTLEAYDLHTFYRRSVRNCCADLGLAEIPESKVVV